MIKAWVDINTNEFIEDTFDGEDIWCNDCNEEVSVKYIEED